MALEILKPGLVTTIQDQGRVGNYHIGMPPSGAMDGFSYRVANMLVGNAEGAAAIEATYMGPQIAFTEATIFAVTGAEMPLRLDGEEIAGWTEHRAAAGQVLSFGHLSSGARPYIAVQGGIDVPEVMGSRSTYTLVGMGGFEGRALQKGDLLPVGAQGAGGFAGRSVPTALIPTWSAERELRVVVGLASYRIVPESLDRFFATSWKVTPDANRTGYRFQGGRVEFVDRTPPPGAGSDPANVTDIGYPIGSVQVPDGTEPIALLNDAVTGGGYATIATIISTDLAAAGQTKTGDSARFIPVTLEQALRARHDRRERLAKVRDALTTN